MKCLGVPPGPRQAPTDISHFGANVVAGLVHVILIMIARHTLATTIRELWKKHKQASKQCLLPTSSRGYMSYLGPQGKFVDRERTCKDLGFCFYGGLSVPKKRKKKKETSWVGWPDPSSSWVAGSAFTGGGCLWSGCFCSQKLVSGLYITAKLSAVDSTSGLWESGNQLWNIMRARSLAKIFKTVRLDSPWD